MNIPLYYRQLGFVQLIISKMSENLIIYLLFFSILPRSGSETNNSGNKSTKKFRIQPDPHHCFFLSQNNLNSGKGRRGGGGVHTSSAGLGLAGGVSLLLSQQDSPLATYIADTAHLFFTAQSKRQVFPKFQYIRNVNGNKLMLRIVIMLEKLLIKVYSFKFHTKG